MTQSGSIPAESDPVDALTVPHLTGAVSVQAARLFRCISPRASALIEMIYVYNSSEYNIFAQYFCRFIVYSRWRLSSMVAKWPVLLLPSGTRHSLVREALILAHILAHDLQKR